MTKKNLVAHLKDTGVLKTLALIKAFEAVDRIHFVSEALKGEAYVDAPLPIGWGQTISQPYTVAFMLELLQPQAGQKILDIGSGSGWTTALLAHIVGEKGKVFAVEVVSEIFEFGKDNLEKYFSLSADVGLPHPHPLRDRRGGRGEARDKSGRRFKISNVVLLNQSGWEGLPEEAPFDRILVSAAAPEVPGALKRQLKIGGRLVIPVGEQGWGMAYSQSVKLLKKIAEDEFEEKDYPGFAFVPLVKK